MPANIMLALGDYRFSIEAAAYQELVRATEYRWAASARIGRRPARQFVGIGEDTIELRGTVYPHYRGGLGQLAALRAEAGRGVPLPLVSGAGEVMGDWVIERVEETQQEFWADGSPRRQEFRLELAAYGEDA